MLLLPLVAIRLDTIDYVYGACVFFMSVVVILWESLLCSWRC